MNKREKIIVFLAMAAVFYGILDYFVFSSSKKGENEKIPSGTVNQTSQIFSKIDSGALSLASMGKNTKKMDYQISMIESEWKSNPFTKPDKSSGKNQKSATTDETQEFVYSGFIQIGQRILVIINGMEYTTGETIKDTGYKILKVAPNTVVLTYDDKKQMVLHLKEG